MKKKETKNCTETKSDYIANIKTCYTEIILLFHFLYYTAKDNSNFSKVKFRSCCVKDTELTSTGDEKKRGEPQEGIG